MKARTFYTVIALACLAAVCISSTAWALDEAVLTPTNASVKVAEEDAFSCRYACM